MSSVQVVIQLIIDTLRWGKVRLAIKVFWRIILGSLGPLFWISGDVSSGFQRMGSALYVLRRQKQ